MKKTLIMSTSRSEDERSLDKMGRAINSRLRSGNLVTVTRDSETIVVILWIYGTKVIILKSVATGIHWEG